MTDDEFWVEPLVIDGSVATVRGCFNQFSITVSVMRKDGLPISETDAERACLQVMSRIPRRVGREGD